MPPTYDESNSALAKLVQAWKLLDKPLILTREALRESVYSLSKLLPGDEDFQATAIEELRNNKSDNYYHPSQPDDVAFFNLTSGSTGGAKCVMVTHRNIISRARGAIQLCQQSSEDILLHWLPFDHTAGISEAHLRCVYLGCKLVYVPKEYVLKRILNWLDLIDKYRITHSFAPNFAYSLINDALLQAWETPKWDLSCVKSLIMGGEAVSDSVVKDFHKNLSPYGLKETAIQPAFGMSELASGITFFQHTQENHPKFHTVDRYSLSGSGSVINVSPDNPNSITFASLGSVIPGISIRIVDSENILLPEDTVGRFQVKGEAVSPGYYKAPEVNSEVFLETGWFDTGDLGFISKGNLVLTGRAKETIIINGANYYNREIEAVVEEVEGVDVSYTAACSVRDSNSVNEKLAIFFSSSLSDDDRLIKLIGKIQERVVRKVRVSPDYLIPVEQEAIPKTAIGKIQRSPLSRRFEAGEFDAILKRLDIISGNANTLPDWFYRKIWRPKEAVSLATQPATGQSLVFLDQLGLGELLCGELGKLNSPCVGVEAGSDFSKLAQNRYRIDPNNPDHYRQLLESLSENDIPITQVLHLWTYDKYAGEISSPEALEQSQELGVYSLLFLIQALALVRGSYVANAIAPTLHSSLCQGTERSVRLYVIASHTQPTSPADEIACEKAPVLGLVKTIPTEMPWLDCRHVDVTPEQLEVNAAHILQELRTHRGDREVAYRNGQRMVVRLEKVDHSQDEKQELPFKHGGMYLLNGGLGGIGVEIAQYLLKHYQARLLLVGRTPLPERSTWDTYLEQEDAVSQRIKAYLALEQLGGEISYEAVDICDLARLQQIVGRAKSRWQCELDGALHLAGIYQELLLLEETRDSLAATLRPKVLGTWVLHQLLKDQPHSVFISFSSVIGFFGGAMVGAFAAANGFLDCFSHYQRSKSSLRSYCFSWSNWDEMGISRNYEGKAQLRARGYQAMSVKQGLNSFLVGLHHDQAQLLVGLDGSKHHIRRYTETKSCRAQKLSAYFTTKANQVSLTRLDELVVRDRFQTQSTCDFLQLQEMPLLATGEIDREQLAATARRATAILAPRNELERHLVSIWQEVLSVPQVGIHDNFFELGGTSLLAVRLFSNIEQTFGKNFPLSTLFQSPTIEQLANILQQEGSSEASSSLVAIQPAGSKPPLFCIGGSGGEVLYFRDLSNHLGLEQPVYGLQAQGLDGLQAPHTRIEDMAAHYIKEMRTLQPEGPYFLAGHSMGGLVAFEMAQQLQMQGQKVALLALFDTCTPEVLNYILPVWDKVYFHWINFVQLERKKKLIYALRRVEHHSKNISKKIASLVGLDSKHPLPQDLGGPEFLPQNIRRIYKLNDQAAKDYVPQVYLGRVTLFKATDIPTHHLTSGATATSRRYPLLGWDKIAVRGVEVHSVPGAHSFEGSMLNEPHVRVLAEKLKACLEQAQVDNSGLINSNSDATVVVGNQNLTIDEVVSVARHGAQVRLTDKDDILQGVQASCDYITDAVASGKPIYGVTSGFGGMANIEISPEDAASLQNNLMWYHKCGAGQRLPLADVRAAMLLRASSHLYGASGIRLELIQRMETFLNAGVTPHVYEFGSIGASGDLTPLSYIAGALIGLDTCYTVDFKGEEIDAPTALRRLGLPPLQLLPKEGLAMMNGTSVMTGIAANCVYDARVLLALTMGAHALAIQGLHGTNQSFHPFIHNRKPHPGQKWAATHMLDLLAGSQLIRNELDGSHDYRGQEPIQDRYSLRCLPQYMGPIVDGLEQIARQIEIEINSVTDNPLIDVENGASYHGGNFLGQYVGMGMDHLRYYIGLLAKHLDVQIALLVAPEFNNGLPPSLVGNPTRSVNMGLKGLQITGNSIMPLLSFYGNSIADRFPTHAEQFNQNINSQGYASANLARRSIDIFQQYMAIALMFGVQAVDLRTYVMAGHYDARACLSPATLQLYTALREVVGQPPTTSRPYIWNDREQALDSHIARIAGDIAAGGRIVQAVNDILSSLN